MSDHYIPTKTVTMGVKEQLAALVEKRVPGWTNYVRALNEIDRLTADLAAEREARNRADDRVVDLARELGLARADCDALRAELAVEREKVQRLRIWDDQAERNALRELLREARAYAPFDLDVRICEALKGVDNGQS